MKGFHRQNKLFSLCGLNCGLCPMYLNKNCLGCGEENHSCKIARCSMEHNEIEYCFSSDSIKTRFIALRNGFYEETEDSLSNRFKMDFRVSKDLTDVNLYRKVESRGFLIFFNGEEITWQRALRYDGQKLEKMS